MNMKLEELTYIGPFFWIRRKLLFNICAVGEGRKQWDKEDNSYSHEQLYDDHFDQGDYIDHPRGRVVRDLCRDISIIYIDRCINRPKVIEEIVGAFNIDAYEIQYDDHYRCRRCIAKDERMDI